MSEFCRNDEMASPSDREASSVLARIDPFEILERVGGSVNGAVYRALDTRTGDMVAIRPLPSLFVQSQEALDAICDVFRHVVGFAHSNIVGVKELRSAEVVEYFDEATQKDLKVSVGDPILVSAFAPGIPLSRWKQQFLGGIVPTELAYEIVAQVAQILDAAHAEQVFHFDVNPCNLMVEAQADGSLVVRVLDFGISAGIRSVLDRFSPTGALPGTRLYMAPEQWSGDHQDDRTDQYALACILYELLASEPPFAGVFETGDMAIAARAVLSEFPEPIETLWPERNEILLKALSKNPEDRFSSCVEFMDAFADPESIAISKPSVPEPTPKPLPSAVRSATQPQKKRVRIPSHTGSTIVSQVQELPASRRVGPSRWTAFASIGLAVVGVLAYLFLIRPALANKRLEAQQKACIANMKQIETACENMLAERLGSIPKQVSVSDLCGPTNYIREEPRCPSDNAQYSISVKEDGSVSVFCSNVDKGHSLDPKLQVVDRNLGKSKGKTRMVKLPGGAELELVWIPSGKFKMGSADSDADGDEQPIHTVRLKKGFWMGKYEVTQYQWTSVMGSDPSLGLAVRAPSSASESEVVALALKAFATGPVENVSWTDCMNFIEKVNMANPGLRLALPTEAQWEYAARGGAKSSGFRYSGGNGIEDVAWFADNSKSMKHPVGEKNPNELGLYDMSGNVCEWCRDRFGEYTKDTVTDPIGPALGEKRVIRGGAYDSAARRNRSTARSWAVSTYKDKYIGFRVVALEEP